MAGKISIKLGMKDSPPDDQKVQDFLELNEVYVGLGTYKSHGIDIGRSGKQQFYTFELDGRENRYTAKQVIETLNI